MDYRLVTCKEELAPYLPAIKQAKVLAVDTETTGLNPHTDRIRLIQVASDGLPVILIDCFTFLPDGLGIIKDILEHPSVNVFQNAKFDLQFFAALGIRPAPLFDTMLAEQLLRQHGIKQRRGADTEGREKLQVEFGILKHVDTWVL